MIVNILIFFSFRLSIIYFFIANVNSEDFSMEYCEKSIENGQYNEKCGGYQSHFLRERYIFYDVNPPEGFNLRRDVYIRVATFVKQLADEDKQYHWNLVLPPWGNLYHWRSTDIAPQKQITWGTFFDIESLKKYAPVIEMYEFIKRHPVENEETVLDQVYFLRNDEEMFKTGDFKNKNIVTNCPKTGISYKKRKDGKFTGFFWGYANVTAKEFKCITFHGTTFDLKTNLHPDLYRTIMFDHMEIPLHYAYGSVEYWKARRSMRYNSELYEIANKFRLVKLNSNDVNDNTEKPTDWRLEKRKRNAIGGPYLAVHFRRKDFVIGHATTTPTIESAAIQIQNVLKMLNLHTVFIATDTDEKEYILLRDQLKSYEVIRFIPTKYEKEKFKDGGVAIIDQIICSHARYFIGTHESTFTFRIQEDREILGFPTNTTFNKLCANKRKCSAGGKWEIEWD